MDDRQLHAAGWLSSEGEGTVFTQPRCRENTDNVYVMVRPLGHMQRKPWQFLYNAGQMFPQCKGQRKHRLWSCLPPGLLKQSSFYTSMYKGLQVTNFPPNVKFLSTVGMEGKSCFTNDSKIFCQGRNCQLPTFTSLGSGIFSYLAEHSPDASPWCNWQWLLRGCDGCQAQSFLLISGCTSCPSSRGSTREWKSRHVYWHKGTLYILAFLYSKTNIKLLWW